MFVSNICVLVSVSCVVMVFVLKLVNSGMVIVLSVDMVIRLVVVCVFIVIMMLI